MLHVSMGNKLVHWFMIILKGTLGGSKIRLSEILKVNFVSRPLPEQHYIRGSLSIENTSFS